MNDVAIMGAGELGGALAHLLAQRNSARVVRLIDEAGRIAAGKALDIAEAAPIVGSATEIVGSSDAAAAAIVVIADRAGGNEWQGEEGLILLRRLAQMVPNAIIVCAGASQRDLVDRGAGELGFTRAGIFGSAPEALTGAVRAIVALETDRSPGDVALTVLGVPPSHIVIPWEDATIGGFAATRLVDEPARRRIAATVPALWPPGPYALAAAAVKVIEAIVGGSRRLSNCFVAPEKSARTRTAALPVRLGPSGIVEVVLPELSAHDRVALDNAMML